jgi:catechol 2,3-dioxygenase-like lactoylglutathione lyase family enzyme
MKARTVPILPCADLDDSIAFYQALGFELTYRQHRPNPSAVVELGEIGIHLFELEGFDPAPWPSGSSPRT